MAFCSSLQPTSLRKRGANIILKNGRGTIHIKGGYEGRSSIIVGAQNAESKKLAFVDFFPQFGTCETPFFKSNTSEIFRATQF